MATQLVSLAKVHVTVNQHNSCLLLFSGDVNFASELSDLRYRHHLHIILIHPRSSQEALLACAHQCHIFEEFTAGLADRSSPKVRTQWP